MQIFSLMIPLHKKSIFSLYKGAILKAFLFFEGEREELVICL